MVNFVARFIPNLSSVSDTLRGLLRKDSKWVWESHHKRDFDRIKCLLGKAPVLKYFEPKEPIILQVDASNKGFGAGILQNNQPVVFASRALIQGETNYAQIEKELRAVLFECEKFQRYIYGICVTVETDHKPLLGIMKKPLQKISPRLQNMRLKLMKYDLKLKYVSGNKIFIADTLSRAPVVKEGCEAETEYVAIHSIKALPMSNVKKQKYLQAILKDQRLCIVKEYIRNGWPKHYKDVPNEVKGF